MNITESKMNDVKIDVLKAPEEFTEKTVKGWKWVKNPYSNIFTIAKKHSGKSTIVRNIVKNVIDKRTKVMIFSGSVSKDPVYLDMIKWMKDKEIKVETYPSFIVKNGGQKVNMIEQLMNVLSNSKSKADEIVENEEKKLDFEDKRPKRKKKEKIVPELLLIFDDLGATLRDQSIATLTKLNRQFKIMNIFSFHAGTDVLPATQQQSDVTLLFGGYPEEKLEKLYESLVPTVDFETWKCLYNHATQKRFDFLYLDVRANEYRKNFDTKLTF